MNQYYTLDNYTHVTQHLGLGSFITIFVKTQIRHLIRQIGWSHVQTNSIGTKGAVSIRFQFQNTTFVFVNAHLESGVNQQQQRLENMKKILEETQQ